MGIASKEGAKSQITNDKSQTNSKSQIKNHRKFTCLEFVILEIAICLDFVFWVLKFPLLEAKPIAVGLRVSFGSEVAADRPPGAVDVVRGVVRAVRLHVEKLDDEG